MDMLDKFIEYLKPQVGTAIYVWGGQGQTFKTRAKMVAFIKKMETSTKNANRAIALLDKRLAAGIPIKEIAAYDCSGLGVDFLLEEGLISKDTTANGLYYNQCTAISKSDLQAGDLVFKKYSTKNKVYHVGIYIGNGEVVHAKGRDYGVVREPISATKWNRYGRLKAFENEIEESEGDIMIKAGQKDETTPGAVYYYQDACKRAGYDIGTWPTW